MFDFLKKRAERKRKEAERRESFQKIGREMESGKGNPLEAALVLHSVEKSQESYMRLLVIAMQSEVITFNKGPDRFGDAMLTRGSDGSGYVACFTSDQRIGPTGEFGPFTRKGRLLVLELIHALSDNAGIVLNLQDEHLNWTFTPEDIARMRLISETSFNLDPGNIYTVWESGAYRVVKLLRTDDKGVHVRLFANTSQERPAEVDLATLSMASDPGGAPKAIGHLPITKRTFLAMGPKRIGQVEVAEDELDGYKIWQEHKGGYFGA